MGLVLWVDQDEVATGLIERIFKDKGEKIHTVASAADFSYLIEDLGASLIVIDGGTALKDLSALKKQYVETNGFFGRSVILLDETAGLEFIQNVVRRIRRPLDPFKLADELKEVPV